VLTEQSSLSRFAAISMPHMDAAFSVARWLTRDKHDAEDWCRKLICAHANLSTAIAAATPAWILTIVRRS
jgi:RNA polymerase sigma-70 factor, ECF subfamily